ncbi:MAG: hypothetical protein LBU60_03665 [Clostridiales bacterium]|jgi:hypothetical protein|nr:hypothetical protein [Clostridiales bacterium]
MKEYFRKKLVTLKKKPNIIPFLLICFSMAIFTFNLSDHSEAVMHFEKNNSVAPILFVTTLASMMSIISFIGYKKKFDRSAILAVSITCILLILQLVLQLYYLKQLNYDIANSILRPIPESASSRKWTVVHIVFLSITLFSIATLPLYKKALQLINTTPKSQLEMVA